LALPATIPQLQRNDLLHIDGIDPTLEMALNSIGIRKFADFRGYTPETLAQALQERTGIAVVVTTIAEQDWIGWAELFAAEAENEKTIAEASGNGSLSGENFHETQSDGAKKISRAEAARPAMESSADAGITANEEHKPETPSRSNGKVVLSILPARFNQFEKSGAANAAAMKFLRSEIDCHVAGANALSVTTDGLPLCTQVFAINTTTEEYKMLASQWERFQPSRSDYRFCIEFEAPPVGRYQLKIVTFLLEANPKIAFEQGPILRVVP